MGDPTLKEFVAKDFSKRPLCISSEALDDGDDPLKPSLIQYLPIFEGFETENPRLFLTEFYTTYNSMNHGTTPLEQLLLKALPFSLKGEARDWLTHLLRGSINTWVDIKKRLL